MTAPATDLDSLIEEHWPRLYRIALAVVRDPASAEDAAQETLVRLVREKERGGRIEDVAAWLATVVLNEARKTLRSNERRARREQAARPRTEGAMDPTAAIREYAEGLPEKLRTPLVLHFGLGLSQAEVAAALGDPKPTVASRIQSGVEQLRRELAASSAFASIASGALIESGLRDGWEPLRAAPVPRAPAAKIIEGLVAKAPAAVAGATVLHSLVALGAVALVAAFAVASREGPSGAEGSAAVSSAPSAPRVASVATEAASPSVARVEPVAPAPAPATPGDLDDPPPPPSPRDDAPAGRRVAVRGRVLDPEKRPVAGARVVLRRQLPTIQGDVGALAPPIEEAEAQLAEALAWTEHHEEMATATTDDGGRFAFDVADPRQPLSLSASFERARQAHWGCTKLGPGSGEKGDLQSIEADVTLERCPAVTVVVREGGVPVAGAAVTFHEVAPPEPPVVATRTGADGSARSVAHARELGVSVERAGAAAERRVLAIGTDDVPVAIDLVRETPCAGRVTDAAGAPVPRVWVHAVELGVPELRVRSFAARSCRTDAEGLFAIAGLGPGRRYRVEVEAEAPFLRATKDVATPVERVDFALERACSVHVKPEYPEEPTEKALAGAVIRIEAQRGARWVAHDTTASLGKEGGPVDLLAPGTYRIQISLAGFAPARSAEFLVRPGDATLTIPVTFVKGRTLAGIVVDAAGNAVPRAIVLWRGPSAWGTVTQADGRFRLDDLPDGALVLTVERAGFVERTVEVAAGVAELPAVVLEHDK